MSQNLIEDETYEQMFEIEDEAERSGSGIIEDPYPLWADLLAKAPVHPGTLAETMGLPPELSGSLYHPGFNYFSVFSFAAVSEVFTRRNDFGSQFYTDIGLPQALGENILTMDGLRHRRYRNLIQEHFQPEAASSWWHDKIIAGLVNDMVGRFEKTSQVDLNTQFFARLPMHTVTSGFGLSASEGIAYRRQLQVTLNHASSREVIAEAAKASDRILEGVIRARQQDPQDDVISKIACAVLEEDDGSTRHPTVDEVIAFCRLIIFAGGGTTWRQLGITLFALLNNPDQLQAVMADRSLVPNAVLESARWFPNDPLFPRKAIRDTHLQGVDIPKGSVMHLCLGAANRDPERWADPAKYDVFRPVQRSVAFAAGAHSCLGQHVARQEMVAAMNALFDRFPNIRWDPSKPAPRLTGGMLARGPGPLHVLLH